MAARTASRDRDTGRYQSGTVAKLAMRQPFVLFKGLHFKNSAYCAHFAQGDHHNKMLSGLAFA